MLLAGAVAFLKYCQPKGLESEVVWDLAFSLAWRIGACRKWIEGWHHGTTGGASSVYGRHFLDRFHNWDTESLRQPGLGRRAKPHVRHVKRAGAA